MRSKLKKSPPRPAPWTTNGFYEDDPTCWTDCVAWWLEQQGIRTGIIDQNLDGTDIVTLPIIPKDWQNLVSESIDIRLKLEKISPNHKLLPKVMIMAYLYMHLRVSQLDIIAHDRDWETMGRAVQKQVKIPKV